MSFTEDEGYYFDSEMNEEYTYEPIEKEQEMQITGTIQSVAPTGSGYNSAGGYIHTFTMVVADQQGQQHTGEIGSKSAQYPMNPGEQITVNMTNTQYGVKFKKVNPGYGQPQGQQQPPQNQQRPPQNDQKAEGMVRHGVVCAAIQSRQIKCDSPADILDYTKFIMTGVWPGPINHPQDNPGVDDDIPF